MKMPNVKHSINHKIHFAACDHTTAKQTHTYTCTNTLIRSPTFNLQSNMAKTHKVMHTEIQADICLYDNITYSSSCYDRQLWTPDLSTFNYMSLLELHFVIGLDFSLGIIPTHNMVFYQLWTFNSRYWSSQCNITVINGKVLSNIVI